MTPRVTFYLKPEANFTDVNHCKPTDLSHFEDSVVISEKAYLFFTEFLRFIFYDFPCSVFRRQLFPLHFGLGDYEAWGSTLKSTLTFQKNLCYLLDWKPFKSDKKFFLFQLKSSFCSQDIQVVTTFWSCRKSGLIRKIRLTSKFMTWQPGWETIAIHKLPNISQSKDNQAMKIGQLIEYNKRNIWFQKLCRKWGKETSSRLLFIY